jgi:shikimate dehydrogenase
MQNAAFAALGLGHVYELADVPAEQVAGELDRLRRADGLGANVTTPHKALVAGLVDELRGDAARLGAVNTVVVEPDGRLVGHNTDLPAAIDELVALVGAGRSPEHAVVLGSGGASAAILAALEAIGARRVTQVTRHRPGPTFADLAAVLLDADLVVNTTPVGTGEAATPIPCELLRPDLAVFDLIYRPSPTRLVREARQVGANARGGASMLLGQGWRSLELWLGRPAPVEAMRAALREELGDADV